MLVLRGATASGEENNSVMFLFQNTEILNKINDLETKAGNSLYARSPCPICFVVSILKSQQNHAM